MIPIHRLSGRLGNQMFQLAYLYSQVNKGLIPDIYVQDPKYFENVKDGVRQIFAQTEKPVPPLNYVSIHVRRGDYVDNPFYVDLVKDGYYERAMALFPNERFLVFSDDTLWCELQDVFDNCEFSYKHTEIDDFNDMVACKAHIIANSSFSWWAAFISGKKTVAPAHWYTDGVERTKLMDNWIKV